MEVRVYEKIAYLPINKNASSTFSNVFSPERGWSITQLDLLDDSYEIFSHFRDPIDRHFKGTVEFLIQQNLTHLIDDPDWQKVWVRSVMDRHSYPLTWALGNYASKIHWIPIHKLLPTNLLTHKYLMARGIDMGLLSCRWINESSSFKQHLYFKLKLLHETIDNSNHLCFFYDQDIVLWNKIIPYTDEDGVLYRIH